MNQTRLNNEKNGTLWEIGHIFASLKKCHKYC